MSATRQRRKARWKVGALVACAMLAVAACSDDEADTAAADTAQAPSAPVTVQLPERGTLDDAGARALFATYYCNACHEVDEFRIGPAYRDVARRYEGDAAHDADWLARKIVHGGAGSWGVVPMVSNPELTPAEAHAIATWILSLDTDPAQ